MSLREKMARYEKLTGDSAERIPLGRLGGFLDGVDRGIEELEKIKDRLETAMWYNRRDKEYCLDLINKIISELKWEDKCEKKCKECPYYDSEAETCRRSETEFDELNNLYYGMTDSMQKAVKDIMLVANGKEIEE